MSIAIQHLAVSQEDSPLKQGENNISFTYRGMVDGDEDNDVSINATIEKDVPLTFKDSKKKSTNLEAQTFPVGSLDDLESLTAVVVSKSSAKGATARITLVFKTAKGENSTRNVSVTF